MQKEEKNISALPEGGASKKPIVAGVVTALIAAALLTPCILASASSTIYPRTTVAGISVGGMTRAEAERTLERQLSSVCERTALPITVTNESGIEKTLSLSLGDLQVQADAHESAAAAWENGRLEANFFTGGISYVKGLLFGHEIAPVLSVEEENVAAEVAALAERVDQPVVECSWRMDGNTMYVTKPRAGAVIDQEKLCRAVKTAVASYDLEGVTAPLETTEPASVSMAEIYADAHQEASNAYYDKASGTVKEGTGSVEFDAAAAQKTMDAAAEGSEFSVPVTVTAPKISKATMEKNLFRDQLGSCTTSVSGSSNRKHNVSLATKSCNGVILNPGETFSYNSTLGQRTAARGYLPAGAYVGGKTVTEYGGGICQISSTLYLAVLRSNLEIVSRTNHMFYPGYIPLGLDATVSWGGPDFQFRNNTDYPIKIVATYTNGSATCTIYGTNVTGNSVKMEYTVLSTTAYKTVEQQDNTLAAGTRRQEQSGYTGYKVASYRCVYDKNGNLISRTLEANSTYKSRDQIILVGPAASQTPTTKADTPASSGKNDASNGSAANAGSNTNDATNSAGSSTPSTPPDNSGASSGDQTTEGGASGGDAAGEEGTQTPPLIDLEEDAA